MQLNRICRPRELGISLTVFAGLAACSARPAGAAPMTAVRLATGLARPVSAASAPGDAGRLFLVEQAGIIRILDLASNTVLPTPFLDIDASVVDVLLNGEERGLLGLAFHPNYSSNGYFYVNYVNTSNVTVIARFQVSSDPNVANAASELPLLTYAQPFSNHNGGWMGFGPNDGYLYISSGDGGSGCDPGQRAQDITDQRLGKILRIDVDGDDFPGDPQRNYRIPPTNPFVGAAGDDEIWAYGLRNPWRCSFDRLTGDLYIADVGQIGLEEVNFQPASGAGGVNYGWDCREGNACANTVSAQQCAGSVNGCSCTETPGLTDPIHVYPRTSGVSITGGYVYRGCRIPGMGGHYFFADWGAARIWTFAYTGSGTVPPENVVLRSGQTGGTGEIVHTSVINQIASFAEDAGGELYIIDRGGGADGQVFKIVPLHDGPGDINADGVVDLIDAGALVDVLLGIEPDDPALVCRCDVNGDGQRDGRDIQSFVDQV